MPVNARFAPEPGPVPGYVDPVVMSSGSFVSGRDDRAVVRRAAARSRTRSTCRAGITAEHAALGAVLAAEAVLRDDG